MINNYIGGIIKKSYRKYKGKIVQIINWKPKKAKWHIKFLNYDHQDMLVDDEKLIRFESTDENELVGIEKKMYVRIKTGILGGKYNNEIGRIKAWSTTNLKWKVEIYDETIRFLPWEIDVNDWNIQPQPQIAAQVGIIVPLLESEKEYRTRVKLLQYDNDKGKWKVHMVDDNNKIQKQEGYIFPRELLLSNIGQPMPNDSMYSVI